MAKKTVTKKAVAKKATTKTTKKTAAKVAKGTTKKTTHKKSQKSAERENTQREFAISSWVETFKVESEVETSDKVQGFIYYLGSNDTETAAEIISETALSWQISGLLKNIGKKEVTFYVGETGPVWIISGKTAVDFGHEGLLDESLYTFARDTFGGLLNPIKAQNLDILNIHFIGTSDLQELGALVGMDLSVYNFKQFMDDKHLESLPEVILFKEDGDLSEELIAEAMVNAQAVNVARHLVDLPPNLLNPKSFATLALENMEGIKEMSVEIWDAEKLAQENMNLHLAVGKGAENTSIMVHMKYRPETKSKLKPVAFVGKGITFDTGGLDIKPSSAMRLMKKDMGGAACVLALANWAIESNYPAPLDFYLALAENAVDGKSFRPGDVLVARNGMTVEIDNTDAEGRLVLADVLDVAANQTGKDEPEYIIDVATLTGAIKVGLGAEIAGLFSTDDELAFNLTTAGQRTGDRNWRMPLFNKYWSDLSSPFADCKNSGGGFGGAITAALFLQKFVGNKKWAHLDVYAWNDGAKGAMLSAGGSGQPVQCLIEFLDSRLS